MNYVYTGVEYLLHLRNVQNGIRLRLWIEYVQNIQTFRDQASFG